jgi:hypothetical protein
MRSKSRHREIFERFPDELDVVVRTVSDTGEGKQRRFPLTDHFPLFAREKV